MAIDLQVMFVCLLFANKYLEVVAGVSRSADAVQLFSCSGGASFQLNEQGTAATEDILSSPRLNILHIIIPFQYGFRSHPSLPGWFLQIHQSQERGGPPIELLSFAALLW